MTANRATRRRGFSLVEVMTVCIITGVLASMSVPRFSRAMEQSRANLAVANLRAIWTAQRAFWLDPNNNNTFAPDLASLRALKLIDRAIVDDPGDSGAVAQGISYVYLIAADPSGFKATARRVNGTGSSVWVSTLAIDANGDVTGNVQYGGSSRDFTGANGGSGTIDQFFQ